MLVEQLGQHLSILQTNVDALPHKRHHGMRGIPKQQDRSGMMQHITADGDDLAQWFVEQGRGCLDEVRQNMV